jgi:hypothetical protein
MRPAEACWTISISPLQALGLQDFVGVERDIDLVGDLDDHIGITVGHDPCGGVRHGGDQGGLVGQALILAEIEVTQDHDHPELVGAVDDTSHARGVVGPQASIRLEGGVVPGLLAGVALRAAALEIDGEGEQPRASPAGHGGDELASITLGIERAIGIIEHRPGRRVQVVERALHHPSVQEQPLDALAAEVATGVGGAAIDQKAIAFDVDLRPAQSGLLRFWQARLGSDLLGPRRRRGDRPAQPLTAPVIPDT